MVFLCTYIQLTYVLEKTLAVGALKKLEKLQLLVRGGRCE